MFLATGQDRMVDRFKQAFGDRVTYLTGVRRTRAAKDVSNVSTAAAYINPGLEMEFFAPPAAG